MPKSLLQYSSEVETALQDGLPVVALESTVLAHGLPYPVNLETARRMETAIREQKAVPATIAVLGGKLRVGLTAAELEHLAIAKGIRKVSRRDLPIVAAECADGATTVATTMTIADWAGIELFATGGIGGVHRDAPFDISNDLPTLGSVPVAVVCSGAKAILDLRATREWLETAGVPVIGYGTDRFPAFFSRSSGLGVDAEADTPDQAAALIYASRQMALSLGILIVVPVPIEHEVRPELIEAATASALLEVRTRGIEGSAVTPFMLDWIARQTDGASLAANVALLENNARVAAEMAVALKAMER